jgi:hypothetical protein
VTDAPLTIDGFSFVRTLGNFEIGDSFLYEQAEPKRQLHVLLGRHTAGVDELIAAFEQAVGAEATEIIEFAGLTNRGRPYLITTFLDDQNIEATFESHQAESRQTEPPEDQTLLSTRTELDDETLLSARGTLPAQSTTEPATTEPAKTSAEADRLQSQPANRAKLSKLRIHNLVVTEREAYIPNPLSPADAAWYQPREVSPAVEPPTRLNETQGTNVLAPQVNRLARETRRARWSLLIIAASVALSATGTISLFVWFVTRL